MNSIYILVALIFGMGIGSIVSFIVIRKILSDIQDNEHDNYEFIKHWSELTDKQYENTRDYVGKIVDLFKQQVGILIETDSKLLEAVKEMATAVDTSIKTRFDAFTASRLDVYDVLREDVNDMQKINNSRWKVIQDSWAEVDQYMTNRVRKPDFQDFLYWLNWHHGIQIMVENVAELASVKVTMYYHKVADRPLVISRVYDPEELSTHMESIIESMCDELFKEAENYEHEEMAAGAGASEGVDARNQEAEQAEVLSGSPDGKLVQSELAEDWLGDPPEAEESQEFDVSVLRAAVDVTYDYDQH